MAQRFYKGRTNNHLSWLMVDATDFATPESALSAATKIKIYGKLRSATGVNFVSSGTGSLTNDIQHIGASALGLYTIALAKADLSDASAAWYDQYIVNLSATGAAYQTLIVDGGIDDSTILAFSDAISNTYSAVLLTQSLASDTHSNVSIGNSRILLVQSRLSDLDSRLASEFSDVYSLLSDLQSDFQSRVPKAVATNSQLSDLASDVKSAVSVGSSRTLLVQSRLSDLDSRLASDTSDLYSLLSDLESNFGSRVPKLVATSSQLSDLASDVKSAVVVAQSAISDVQSAVAAVDAKVDTVDNFLDTEIAAILAAVDTEIAAIITTLGTPAGASISADLVTIDNFVDDLESRLTAALATKLAAHAAGVLVMVVDAGSTTTEVVFKTVEGAAASATNDFYNGRVIVFTSGALAGQATSISDYVGATKTATVVALTGAPAENVTSVIV